METRNQSHPTPRQLAALALGKLTPEGKMRLEKHVAACESCATFLSVTPRDTLVNLLRQAAAGMSAAEQSTPSVRDASTFSGLAGTQKPVASAAGDPQRAAEQPSPAAPAKSAEQAAAASLDDIPQALREQTKYRIVRLLGRGGMGSVYEAFHERMDRRVAIKVINPALVDHPEALKRFDQEVRAAAKVEHENVARAYDAEELGKLRILVMEFVPGQSLDRYLAKNGPLAVPVACRLIQQALTGLSKAHKLGMVHRDLKPQNLMLTPEGTIKILDFGLAKLVSERQQGDGLTRENALMGTPHYLAPEQALDAAKADIRADIYSLGCTLYCLLAGTTPFTGDTEMKVLLAHQHDAAPPLCEVRPDVPRELSDLVGRMLSKNPAERPQTPADAAQALLPFIKQGMATSQPAAAIAQVATTATVPPAVVTVAPSQRAQRVESVLAAAEAEAPRPRPMSFRQWPPAWRWAGIAGLGLLTGFCALWGVIVLLRTPTGTIVIANVPADAQVQIDGEAVTLSHGGDRDGDKVTIEAVSKGEHRIKLVRNDRTFWSNDVAIQFAGQQVAVKFKPAVDAQGPGESDTVADRQSPNEQTTSVQAGRRDLASTSGHGGRSPAATASANASGLPEAMRRFPDALVGKGTWKRENDEIVQTSLAEEITLLSFGDPAWSRYNISFRARTDAGPFSFCVGWHLQGQPEIVNGRVLRFGNEQIRRIDIVSFVDGGAIDGDAFVRPGTIERNQWHDMRIEVRREHSTCFVDDKQILNASDRTYTNGRVGVGAFGTAYRFKDVMVTSEDGKTVLWQGLPRLPGDEDAEVASAPEKNERNVDLLALVDLTKDKVAGHWTADGKALEATHLASEDFSRLQFPYTPPEEYDYRVSFVCRAQPFNSSALFLICAARQHQFSATYRDPHSGIGLINGERVNDNGTSTTKLADKITPGQQHTALVKVRKDRVQMFFDDELIVEHRTDFQNLSLRYDKKLPRDDTLGLAMADRPLRIEAIEVVEISEPGKLLRELAGNSALRAPAEPILPAMEKYPPCKIFGGDWKIEGDDLVQTAATRGRKLLVFGDPNWSDYDLELETLSQGPEVNSKVCIHWNDEGLAFRMFGLEEQAKRKKSFFRDHKEKWLQRHLFEIPFDRDRWHKVRVEVRGRRCTCFADGIESYKDRKPDKLFDHGRIAVGCAGCSARFRNISVTALDGTVLWRGLPQPMAGELGAESNVDDGNESEIPESDAAMTDESSGDEK
jgi:hypothetical protein